MLSSDGEHSSLRRLNLQKYESVRVVRFPRDCTEGQDRLNRQALSAAKTTTPVLIDLSDVDQIDESFLRLLGLYRTPGRRLGVLVSNTGPGVLFLATELCNAFEVYTDRDDAMDRLRGICSN